MKPLSLFTFELASAERKSKYREQTPSRQSLCWRVEVLDVETWEKTPPSCPSPKGWMVKIILLFQMLYFSPFREGQKKIKLFTFRYFSFKPFYPCLCSSLPVLSESRSIENFLFILVRLSVRIGKNRQLRSFHVVYVRICQCWAKVEVSRHFV